MQVASTSITLFPLSRHSTTTSPKARELDPKDNKMDPRRKGNNNKGGQFFHLCGSPISTIKPPSMEYGERQDAGMTSPNQVRSPETLTPPALHMKDVGETKKKRMGRTLATAATDQDDLFADYYGYPSLSLDKDVSMNDEDDDDYDEGAETDTNSSTHVRVQEGREAKIPLFLSDGFLPSDYDEHGNCVNSNNQPSRVGGRRNSLVAAHESIDISDLALDKVIGEGAFGKVYKGTWKNKAVAVKVLLHQDLRPDVVSEFETEVQIMSVLNHPNICMLLGACLEPAKRALVLELVEQGSLWSVLRSRRRQINDGIRAKFILDTAKGMNYLHQFKRPILHRDMKSPNLLVQKDFSIKISDFGLARVKAQIQTMTGNCGTVQWMA